MRLPTLDKVLICLFILLTAAVWSESARADPAPVNRCDDKCRERRFHKLKSKAGTPCFYHKYRECSYCALGQCMPNMTEDTHTAGLCWQATTTQRYASVPMCREMCPFPMEPPGDTWWYAEAAEQPGGHAAVPIADWDDFGRVHKCFVGQEAKSWNDEFETTKNGKQIPITWNKYEEAVP